MGGFSFSFCWICFNIIWRTNGKIIQKFEAGLGALSCLELAWVGTSSSQGGPSQDCDLKLEHFEANLPGKGFSCGIVAVISSEASCNAFAEAIIVQPRLASRLSSSSRMAKAGEPDTGCGKISGKLPRWKIRFKHIFKFSIQYLQPPESLILIQSSWGRQQQQGGRRKG